MQGISGSIVHGSGFKQSIGGVTVHELAHVYLKHDTSTLERQDKEEFIQELNRVEEETNNLAKKWGFKKEIEALQQWSDHLAGRIAKEG